MSNSIEESENLIRVASSDISMSDLFAQAAT